MPADLATDVPKTVKSLQQSGVRFLRVVAASLQSGPVAGRAAAGLRAARFAGGAPGQAFLAVRQAEWDALQTFGLEDEVGLLLQRY